MVRSMTDTDCAGCYLDNRLQLGRLEQRGYQREERGEC